MARSGFRHGRQAGLHSRWALVLCFLFVFTSAETRAQVAEGLLEGPNALPAIEASQPDSLYDAYQVYALPVRYAFQGGHESLRRLILDRLTAVIDQAITLGELRSHPDSALGRASSRLLDPKRSGPDSRRILPTTVASHKERGAGAGAPPIIDEPGVSTFQFMHLLSMTARYANSYAPSSQEQADRERDQVDRIVQFLVDDWILAYWKDVDSWHYTGAYPNIRERLESRLHPSAWWPMRFFSGVNDEDLHFLATAADVQAILAHPRAVRGVVLTDARRDVLRDASAMTLALLRAKIPDGEGFVFGAGDWYDHPDFIWAGCTSETVPVVPCPRRDVSEDISHAGRWPLWLESFRAGMERTEDQAYIQQLQKRLAYQVANRVVGWDGRGRPFMRNFLDGGDGWYRVGYHGSNFGYGPSSPGGSVYFGSWFVLASQDAQMATFSDRLCSLMLSTDVDDIAFRTQHYGGHKMAPDNKRGIGELDIGGAGSTMATSCRIARELKYF
jgi:hypothetical protein